MPYLENKANGLVAAAYVMPAAESVVNPGYIGKYVTLAPGYNAIDEHTLSVLKDHHTNEPLFKGPLVVRSVLPAGEPHAVVQPIEPQAYGLKPKGSKK